MMSTDKAQITVAGTITDAEPEPPNLPSRRPGMSGTCDHHAGGVCGSAFQDVSGAATSTDDAVMENSLGEFPRYGLPASGDRWILSPHR